MPWNIFEDSGYATIDSITVYMFIRFCNFTTFSKVVWSFVTVSTILSLGNAYTGLFAEHVLYKLLGCYTPIGTDQKI